MLVSNLQLNNKILSYFFSGYNESASCMLNVYDNLKESYDKNECTKQNVIPKIKNLLNGFVNSTIKSRCEDFNYEICKIKDKDKDKDNGE